MQFHIDAFCAQVEGVFLLGGVMPGFKPKKAASKKQLAAAYAHKDETWAKEIIKGTHSTKGLPQRVKKGKK